MRFALIMPLLLAVSAQAMSPGQVIFSELMWMRSTMSSLDEWIELYNRSDEDIHLSGWTITRRNGSEDQTMLTVMDGVVRAKGTFLISNYAAEDNRSRLRKSADLVDTAVSLPNSQLYLQLLDGDPGSGDIIDVADDGSGAPMGGNNELKSSMVRILFDGDGAKHESWSTAREATGWDPGGSELGTPGEEIPAHIGSSATGADSDRCCCLVCDQEKQFGAKIRR